MKTIQNLTHIFIQNLTGKAWKIISDIEIFHNINKSYQWVPP